MLVRGGGFWNNRNMRPMSPVSAFFALIFLAGGCGGPPDPGARRAGTLTSPPSCTADLGPLEQDLAQLDAVRTALAADPMTVRPGQLTGPDTAVVHADAKPLALDNPFTVQLTPQAIFLDGRALSVTSGDTDEQVSFVSRRLGPAAVPKGTKVYARPLVVMAHPGAPWSAVQRVLRAARAAEVPRAYLVFAAPATIAAPSAELRAAVASGDPDVAFPRCPQVAAVLRAQVLPGRDALDNAIRSCGCTTTGARVSAFLYQRLGLVERAGHIPAVVEMPLEAPERLSSDRQTVVALSPTQPWSTAHRPLVDAIRSGKPVWPSLEGERGAERLAPIAGGSFASLTGVGDFSSQLDGATAAGASLGGASDGQDSGFDQVPHDSRQARPQTRLGDVAVTGPLGQPIVRRVLRRKLARLAYCYEKQLLRHPGIAGKVEVRFAIAPTGRVSSASANGVHPVVARCVAGVIQATEFPKPTSGEQVRASSTLEFELPDTSKSAFVTLSRGAVAIDERVDNGRRASAPHARFSLLHVEGSSSRKLVRRAIVKQLPRIRYCYEKKLLTAPGLAGKVTASMTFDTDGRVSVAQALGLHPEVSQCVREVLKALQFPKPKNGKPVEVRGYFVFQPTGG